MGLGFPLFMPLPVDAERPHSTGMRRGLLGSQPKPQRSPILGVLLYLCLHPFSWERGVFLLVSHAPPQRAESHRTPILRVSLCLCLHSFQVPALLNFLGSPLLMPIIYVLNSCRHVHLICIMFYCWLTMNKVAYIHFSAISN